MPRVVETVVNATRKIVGTSNEKEIRAIEIFETEGGVWKFRRGNLTFGNYGCEADARRVAEKYNFIEAKKGNK